MGLFGAIVGGIIGGTLGGGWGAAAGAALGYGSGDRGQAGGRVHGDGLRGPCPYCNEMLVLEGGVNQGYTCNSCHKTFLLIRCPDCGEKAVSDDIGNLQCNSCGRPVYAGYCPACESLVVSGHFQETHSCGTKILYMLFENEDDFLMFMVSAQVALSVLMSKADGHFDAVERQAIREFFIEQGFTNEGLELVGQMIQEFDRSAVSLAGICADVNKVLAYEERLVLLEQLFRVMVADDVVDDAELVLVREAKKLLKIEQKHFDDLYDSYVVGLADSGGSRFYAILGLAEDCSEQELKQRYRELVKQHHPDHHQHKDEAMAQAAAANFIQIQQAYEAICKARAR